MTDPRDRVEGSRSGDNQPGDVGPGRRGESGREMGQSQGDQLELLVGNIARSQPPRRAPASLEARIFAQIAAQPWWRRNFMHWPLGARAAFLVASAGFVKLALTGFMSVLNFVQSSDVAGVDALHRTGEAVSTTVSLAERVLHVIPAEWLYAGAAFAFTLYAVLFGLGTFVYRTLYVQR